MCPETGIDKNSSNTGSILRAVTVRIASLSRLSHHLNTQELPSPPPYLPTALSCLQRFLLQGRGYATTHVYIYIYTYIYTYMYICIYICLYIQITLYYFISRSNGENCYEGKVAKACCLEG